MMLYCGCYDTSTTRFLFFYVVYLCRMARYKYVFLLLEEAESRVPVVQFSLLAVLPKYKQQLRPQGYSINQAISSYFSCYHTSWRLTIFWTPHTHAHLPHTLAPS